VKARTWWKLFSPTAFCVSCGSYACSRDAGCATFPGCRSIAPDTLNHIGASDGDSQFVVDAGTHACYKQPGSDDTETGRITLDSTDSGGAAYPFITRQDVLGLFFNSRPVACTSGEVPANLGRSDVLPAKHRSSWRQKNVSGCILVPLSPLHALRTQVRVQFLPTRRARHGHQEVAPCVAHPPYHMAFIVALAGPFELGRKQIVRLQSDEGLGGFALAFPGDLLHSDARVDIENHARPPK
jgi:hypothetical protein